MVGADETTELWRPPKKVPRFASNKQYNFYNKSMWKYVHPVFGAGIQTHNLSNMSRHP